MAPNWVSLGFSDTEMTSAHKAATEFLGDHPPVWRDQGYDVKGKFVEDYLERLRQTHDSIIAEKMAKLEDVKPVFELLRNKIKYIRNVRGRSELLTLHGLHHAADAVELDRNRTLPKETPGQQVTSNSESEKNGT